MKSFRSKFIALALFAGLLSVGASPASPAQAAFNPGVKCEGVTPKPKPLEIGIRNNNFGEYPTFKKVVFETLSNACSETTPGKVWAYRVGSQKNIFELSIFDEFPRFCNGNACWTVYWIDPIASKLPRGTYRFVHGGTRDSDGQTSDVVESKATYEDDPKDFEFTVGGGTTSTTSTTTPSQGLDRPEVLDDQLVSEVWKSGITSKASVYYKVTVRCSPVCGTLPSNFSAKLCEVGASYMSPTCIASSRPFQIGKAKKTNLGVVNTFVGTFIVEKKTTGKKYRAYLNIPAGKKHKTTLGRDTFVWNGKSSFKNVPSPISVPATTNGPTSTSSPVATNNPKTSTTLVGVPTQSSVPRTSVAPLSVVSDFISGKSSLTVQGSGAAFTLDVTMECSGTCAGLPVSITGSMCKVGTSDADSSCTPRITLSQISGGTSRKATFRGRSNFGLTPTRFVYQPYFAIRAQGITDSVKLSGAARVTWAK